MVLIVVKSTKYSPESQVLFQSSKQWYSYSSIQYCIKLKFNPFTADPLKALHFAILV